ncbi:hypothetical protein EV421DRAFT_1909189 [Armillaria borealis]|uniref:DUF6532 domain-containing protein n=1 Tax=Armillaria borealis TaxID=47425 RepID=A0AA39MHN9_9AGAR|nr:hypothetical protein EV421DRAFT_1909189 [Armillaria borealis]
MAVRRKSSLDTPKVAPPPTRRYQGTNLHRDSEIRPQVKQATQATEIKAQDPRRRAGGSTQDKNGEESESWSQSRCDDEDQEERNVENAYRLFDNEGVQWSTKMSDEAEDVVVGQGSDCGVIIGRAEAGDLGDPDERLIEAFKAKNAARLASKNKQQTATYPLTTKRTQKLQDELPMVTMAKVISSKSNSGRRPEVAVKAEASEAWLDRSDYIQNRSIDRLLDESFDYALYFLVSDGQRDAMDSSSVSFENRMSPKAIDEIAYLALISSAEKLEFTEPRDILERLQRGDEDTYVSPLRSYVAHRTQPGRKAIRNQALTVVPVVYHAYIYEDTVKKSTMPYSHSAAFAPIIAASFFTQGKIAKVIRKYDMAFESLLRKHSKKMEIPLTVLALAATAVYSFSLLYHIADTLHSRSIVSCLATKFAGPRLTECYGSHAVLLNGLRERKDTYYHMLMRNLYKHACGTGYNLTEAQVLAQIDWDGIADSNMNDTPNPVADETGRNSVN